MICKHCFTDADNGQPHGFLVCSSGSSGRGADVTWPGGKTFENLGHEKKTFYSPRELQAYCKAHRIEPFVRHRPLPGTDKSPHTTSWAAVSQATLDGAKALLERVGTGRDPAPQTYIQSMTVTVTEVPGFVTEPITGIHDGL